MASDHRDELALSIAVAVDVALGGLDRPVTGEQLNVAQRACCLVYEPRGPCDKGSAAGVRRTAFEADRSVGEGEPVDDAGRRHRTTALGLDDRARSRRRLAPGDEGGPQARVNWDQPAALLLGCA